MSFSGTAQLEEQLLCSICLEVFTNPVSTPCEHNFCKTCITKHWDTSEECQCPLCKKIFNVRPYLRVNTLFSEIVSQFKKQAQKEKDLAFGSSEHEVSKPGDVPCDVCTEPKLKALKSCLVCLASYCETHLQPHLTVSGLKRHQLMEPVENLEDRMCPKHDKPLELFCRTDKKSVCMICSVLEHKNHEFVPLREEYEEQKASLKQSVTENEQLVKQRRQKIQQIKDAVDLSKKAADRNTKELVKIFTDIVESVQKCLDEFTEVIEETQTKHEKQAQDLVQELEQEICELEKKSTEVEQLSRSEDHLLFLQRSTALRPAAALKDWSTVSFEPAAFEGTAARALSELDNNLSKNRIKFFEAELKRVQKFAADITLDPDTAHCKLVLSKDRKKVHHSDGKKKSPENDERFSDSYSVLGKESFSSGKSYFEVQVEGKTKWDLGIVKESINRKGKLTLKPRCGFWAIGLRENNEYKALADTPVRLSLKQAPQKVGVFVDYIERVVSFHDVDTAAVLYSFSGCDFSKKIFPYLSPGTKDGKNSAPLIITTVGETE